MSQTTSGWRRLLHEPDGFSAVGVERTGVVVLLGCRVINGAQLALALMTTVGHARRPLLDLAAAGAFAVTAAVVAVRCYRARRLLPRWLALDVVVGVTVLLAAPMFLARQDFAAWAAWPYAMTLLTGAAAAAALPAWGAVTAALALAAAYSTWLLHADGHVVVTQILVNVIAYPAFALVLYALMAYLRGLAALADDRAATIARLERERSRAVVHDMLGYLRLDRLLEARPEVRGMLVQQALTKYRQMRSYVDGTDQPGDVEGCLQSVVELYPTLQPRLVILLDDGVAVQDDVAVHLRQAVDTALSNVQANAADAEVVVSAENDADTVTVTVVDDGPGFDPAATAPGFGISETLGRQLASVGGTGRVSSRPGSGTQVEITVPWGGR